MLRDRLARKLIKSITKDVTTEQLNVLIQKNLMEVDNLESYGRDTAQLRRVTALLLSETYRRQLDNSRT